MSMSSKSKAKEWHTCDMCQCHIVGKDADLHRSTCCVQEWKEKSVAKQMLDHLSDSGSTQQQQLHPFVRHQVLYSQVAVRSPKLISYLDAIDENKFVTIPKSAMKLCGIAVGDMVCITRRNSEQILRWCFPVTGGASCILGFSEDLHKELGITQGEWLCVNLYHGLKMPADKMTLKISSETVPNSETRLMDYMRHHENGYFYTAGNYIKFSYLGCSYKFFVSEVHGSDGNIVPADENTESLSESFRSLCVHDAGLSTSTPIKLDHASPTVLELLQRKFYCVCSDTKLNVVNRRRPHDEVSWQHLSTFEQVGGVDPKIQNLRDLITNLLHGSQKYPKGLRKPGGGLFYGSSGTGKTLTAKAIAAENNCHFAVINGPEIFKRYYGDSEAHLRNTFEVAVNKAPSIILIDDIHAFCPKSSSQNQEYRIVYTLASLLDEISEMGSKVYVIATANQLDLVTSILRVPWRFSEEIEFTVPTVIQRKDILAKLFSKIQHSLTQQEIIKIAEITHGFVGADLSALCQTAAHHCLQTHIGSSSESELEDIRKEDERLSREVMLSSADVSYAINIIKPSGLRELAVEIPKVYWKDIGGQSEIKRRLFEAVELPIKHPEVFQRLSMKPASGILMYGPPGCSKTLIAKALATESKNNFIAIKGPELFSKWVGESEKAIRDLYRKARAASPCIVFFDEIDALAEERGSLDSGGSQVGNRVLTQLLTEMDGIVNLENVITIAATNKPDRIDKALMRPGRLDHIVYVPLPDADARQEIFKIALRKKPVSDSVDINLLVESTANYSGAEVVAVCNEAVWCGIRENINLDCLEMIHFQQALQIVRPRIPESMIRFYEEFRARSSNQYVSFKKIIC